MGIISGFIGGALAGDIMAVIFGWNVQTTGIIGAILGIILNLANR